MTELATNFEQRRDSSNRRRAIQRMTEAQQLIRASAASAQAAGDLDMPLALSVISRQLEDLCASYQNKVKRIEAGQ